MTQDTYILSTVYMLIVPVVMLQYPLVVEYWLHSLPSQVRPAMIVCIQRTTTLRQDKLNEGMCAPV